jgi:membrane AbrB-like protein
MLGLATASPPDWFVALVQLAIGVLAGARFFGVRWTSMRASIIQAVLWAIVLVSLAALFAGAIARWRGGGFEDLLVAAAPGGIAEMTIIGYAAGLDVTFIVTCHVLRILVSLLLAQGGLRLVLRGRQ